MSEGGLSTKTVQAPAKVNLFLRVLELRSDGYHELETLILPISLADRLEIHADADPSFRTLAFSLEVTGDDDLVERVPRDEANLVVRACLALARRTGVHGFADISLEKRVPVAAGLGGGSADAAAALWALNDLWGCGLGPVGLRDVGASVGSDVPALMVGGPVLARGRGERVEPAPMRPLSLVLVTFPFSVSAAEAFRCWDQAGGPTGPDPAAVLDPGSEVEALAASLFNDLEEPMTRLHPEIGRAKRTLLEGGALGAAMSGSGPTVYGVMPGPTVRLEARAEREIAGLSGRPPGYVTSTGHKP